MPQAVFGGNLPTLEEAKARGEKWAHGRRVEWDHWIDADHNNAWKMRVAAPPTPVGTATTEVNPKDGLTYVWIPPGKFMMGCSPGDSKDLDMFYAPN
jgi:hypothetical protein